MRLKLNIHILSCLLQGRIQDFKLGGREVGGLGDGSPPVGSRGKAPVGGLGTKSPRS